MRKISFNVENNREEEGFSLNRTLWKNKMRASNDENNADIDNIIRAMFFVRAL